MDYMLMHKDVEVAGVEIDNDSGAVARIGDVKISEHFPVGVINKDGTPNRASLNDWWSSRSIPATRQGIRGILEKFKISSTKLLIEKCMGLSLSDHYWIRPEKTDLKWSDVNFFENSFSEDMGDILFGGAIKGKTNFMSPDNTSDGWLRKRWVVASSKRFLVKGGSGTIQQEPLNEVFATEIMRRLNIPHVPYTIEIDRKRDKAYSICENFLTSQTELISAWDIMLTQKHPKHISDYQHFLKCCDTLGIPDAKNAINKMIVVDFLIVNEDRHFYNLGAVRNADTLKWDGIAPIYDNGTSMWYGAQDYAVGENIGESKPFRTAHSKQIKLVSSLDFIDFSKLSDIADIANEVYARSPFISGDRRSRLCRVALNRVQLLENERNAI
ncbi:hypothetical protein FACS1894187_16750 [Synergistales bacterium]|nr:hypothetical protein FACS1894187_16750 [Synergistales bacterium]